jgi:hypothetical protein
LACAAANPPTVSVLVLLGCPRKEKPALRRGRVGRPHRAA